MLRCIADRKASAAEPIPHLPRCSEDLTGEECIMGFGRGALLWLLGVPLPIIILLALFWR
jgi:hypothetical protein